MSDAPRANGDAPLPDPAPVVTLVPPVTSAAPAEVITDPNANVVYDVLYDIANLELVGQLKWDIFSTEQRLDRALREDAGLERRAPELKRELALALDTFRASEDVAAYKQRFVQNEERLKMVELMRFLELAVIVREPLQEAWAKYLGFDHERLLAELAAVDVDGLAKSPAGLIQGIRESGSRRCNAVVAHTERNARQVFKEIPYRDWSRTIAWHEEKNPALATLIADARVVYLHAEMARRSAGIARELRWIAIAIAAFTAVTTVAVLVALLR